MLAIGTVSPSPAGASRPVPDIGPTTVGSSNGSMDIDGLVTTLKVERAQYLVDNPRLLR